MAQGCHLGIYGGVDGCIYIRLLRLLATVLAAQVPMGPSHPGPLPYRFNTRVDAPLHSVCACRLFLCAVPLVVHLESANEHEGKACHFDQPQSGRHVSRCYGRRRCYLTPFSAGACGIKRTLEVPELSSPNYLSMSHLPSLCLY